MSAINIAPSGRGSWLVRASVQVPRPLSEVFGFFSDAHNLEALTPPWVRFRILTPAPIAMRAGTRIDYEIRVHGIPLRWQTAITVWEPGRRFVDEQVRGPYRMWVHEHTFAARDGGTLCGDQVEYRVPGGALVNRLLVERDVRRIFEYRQRRIGELFA